MENEIIHGECMAEMKKISDKSIDLVLTDPPYGLDKKLSQGAGKHKNLRMRLDYLNSSQWDSVPSDETFSEIFRISKNQIIFGGNYFNLHPTRGFMVWDKAQSLPTFSECEYIWTSFDCPSKIYRQRTIDESHERIHPTQKPVNVISWLLKKFSKEGDSILDPFSGSGTTAIACMELNRRFVCIEKDKGYYERSLKRIAEYKAQLKLFE